jgi:hypothetical protein
MKQYAAELQVNLGFGRWVVSAHGYINDQITTMTATSIPTLLKKLKKEYGIRQEDVRITFQPE